MKLAVVGFGPGSKEYMTLEAKQVIEQSDLIVGYTVYVDLMKPYFPKKEFYTTPMKKETDRCRFAIEETLKGRDVAIICSGDSGVYGMASLIYELSEDYEPFEIHVVSGVTAAISGGAVLGAPLSHDFSVISLSDLLTPWELIEKRIRGAAMADMVICLYNPSSKKRHDYLKKACDIMLEYKSEETVCGYVMHIGREKEEKKIVTLRQLREETVDMFTTVFIGNQETRKIRESMVTPRGYHKKWEK